MKKVIALVLLANFFNTSSFSQEVVRPQKNTTKAISKNHPNNKDSTIIKTSNGFDVKKSKIDNMIYLNVNENNPSLNKMPIAINNLPVEQMPVSKLIIRNEQSARDTSFSINITSDSLKRWKSN